MLPASNKGVGMNMGFPDVCLTPAGPAVVPIPYPNMAMNAMAAPFCPTILLSFMPALNMGSIIPMTLGDQPGVANPLFMQMGMYTMGNPVVMLMGLPAINLTCPTTGNAMNNALGAVLVPSVTNVFFTLAPGDEGRAPEAGSLTEASLRGLDRALAPASTDASVAAAMLDAEVGYLEVRRFSASLPAAVHHAIRGLLARGMTALVLDLDEDPGGSLEAALAVTSDFLEPGAELATIVDADGDEIVRRAPAGAPHRFPLVIVVGAHTASASEIVAGALQAHRRAVVVGERTHGKGTAQAVACARDGQPLYGTVARLKLPGGRALEGLGVTPDVAWPAAERSDFRRSLAALPEPLRAALAAARDLR